MNRVLKQRFTQISRQNNFNLATQGAPTLRADAFADKIRAARPSAAAVVAAKSSLRRI